MTSVDNEELVLISAYDAAVASELSAHIVALQALAAEASAPPPPAPTVAQRTQELKAAARLLPPRRRGSGGTGRVGNGGRPPRRPTYGPPSCPS